eukprot:gene3804-4753_t
MDAVVQKQEVVARWRQTQVLVIDEVSMLSPETLELLDAVGRRCRGKDAPLGGLQVVLCGDFFQLPPVKRSYPQVKLKGGESPASSRQYCFQSDVWHRVVDKVVCLTNVFRQRDRRFVELLNAVRVGDVTDDVLNSFSGCVGRALGS